MKEIKTVIIIAEKMSRIDLIWEAKKNEVLSLDDLVPLREGEIGKGRWESSA